MIGGGSLGLGVTKVGAFVCIEGIDGAGKTTLINNLVETINKDGMNAIALTADVFPKEAKLLREIILNPDNEFTDAALAMLFIAQRTVLVTQMEQLLKEQDVVFCDRWALSTLVYQGMSGAASMSMIRACHDGAVNMHPDLGILLDLPAEEAITRKVMQGGGDDRFESRTKEWYVGLRRHYQHLGNQLGYKRIDATLPEDELLEAALKVCRQSRKFAMAVHS